MLIVPSTARSPPNSSTSPLSAAASSGGTVVSRAVGRPRRCLPVITLARNPAQRAKASGSAPVALTVSMRLSVLNVAVMSLPRSARSAATASVRTRATWRSTTMLSAAMPTPTSPSTRS